MSGPLSQDEIEQLLDAIAAGDEEALESKSEPPLTRIARKIRPFDFKRPDKFLKSRLRELSNAFEDFIRKFQQFLKSEYDITAQIHLAGCDQFPFEEFFRALPPPSPLCTFDWMGGSGAFQIAADVFFQGILGKAPDKPQKLNGLEARLFMGYLFKPFGKILQTYFSKKAGKGLPDFANQKFISDFFIRDIPIQNDMGVVATFYIKIGQTEGNINLFLNPDCINSLNETSFFNITNDASFIPLATPTPNTIVEMGRFHLDDGESLKENLIYETNKLGGEVLDVLKDERFVGEAEGTVIDSEYKAARILSNISDLEEKKFDDFLNTRVIFGCSKTADNIEFGKGCIVPLNEDILEPVKIIKNNKIIGYGEIVIPDENFCVKVTKVVDK
ncbi:MAG: FliM/FliN family flagellar motor switch protein [Treponema sp.]|nr:FliM/FliN family flagellar motor switch protein [Treponema sp.]MBQ8210997.1 FliM/FliN family flagellar motor switch protein [Treponema sp.]